MAQKTGRFYMIATTEFAPLASFKDVDCLLIFDNQKNAEKRLKEIDVCTFQKKYGKQQLCVMPIKIVIDEDEVKLFNL